MKKIIVIGCPGSGKSFYSKKLNEITKIKLYHLDMIYHNSDGSHIKKEEFDKILNNIFKEESYILDGNYQRTIELRLQNCDTVIFLDFKTEDCLNGALSRVGKRSDNLPWVEDTLNEKLKNTILNYNDEYRPIIYNLLDKYKNKINIKIFTDRNEVDAYLSQLKNEINKK